MVTEAWLRQRGLLCPAHSCCPATLAKAASLYLLPLPPIIKPPLLFYHCLLCPTLLTAIIVCFLQTCLYITLCLISAVASSPFVLQAPPPLLCFPSSPLFASHWFTLLLSLTQTHHGQKRTHSPAGDAWQQCVYIVCVMDWTTPC